MENALSIEGLSKSYTTGLRRTPRRALEDLSLHVPAGDTIGLLGPNGAGKTTTLKCIMGLVHPDDGEIRLFDGKSVGAEARKRIGFLPEQPYFDLYLTPRKLLAYYGRLMGMDRSATQARISYLLNLVGLEEEADLPMEKFSKGMLQRMGLAQALITEPEFLILDEPSSGLDPLGILQVRELLRGLKKGGTTILLSSHQLSEIEEICDGVVIIHRGSELASGGLDELLRSRDEFEVVLERPLEAPCEGLPASASWTDPEKTRLMVDKAELNQAMKSLVDGGAAIMEVRQRRMSLEEYFMRKVGTQGWEVGE